MAQILAPISDITALGGSGSGTFAAIDEASFSDADYISSNDNTVVTYECLLSSATDPSSAIDHTISWRQAQADGNVAPSSGGGASTYSAYLYQGGTLIATMVSGETANNSSFLAKSYTLTAGEANAITNYADLRVRFDFVGGGGSPANRRGVAISWVSASIPDVVVTNVTVNLDTLNYTETLRDITASSPASVSLGVLNYTETLQTIDVTSIQNTSVSLDTLNHTETIYDFGVTAVQNTDVSLDVLNFNKQLYSMSAGGALNVEISLDVISFFKTMHSVGLSTGSSILMDILNYNEQLNDVSAGGVSSVSIELGVLNFSQSLQTIGIQTGTNANVFLDVLSHFITTHDISTSLTFETTVNLGLIRFTMQLETPKAKGITVRTINVARTPARVSAKFDEGINKPSILKGRQSDIQGKKWWDY